MRETIKLCCIVALTLCGCAVLLEASSLLHDVHAHATVTLENLDRNLIVLGVTLSEVQKGAKEWQTASKTQASAITQAAQQLNVSAARLSSFLSATDESLNSELLPQLRAAIDAQNAATLSNQQSLNSSFISLQQVLRDADAQINNPAIGQSLANIATGTESLADSAKHIDGVATDAKNLADYEVKQLETPEKVWLAVLKFVLGYGASARGLFIGYK
ncbi:MAG TPA: hypothetical protein VN682_17045 [Terriglobales bacterium]|nr:hypothetical protein [Terriglobales bacterium]